MSAHYSASKQQVGKTKGVGIPLADMSRRFMSPSESNSHSCAEKKEMAKKKRT